MKNRMIHKLTLTLTLAFAMAAAGCVKEAEGLDPATPGSGDEVILRINVPAVAGPRTRAIVDGSADDYAIDELDVVLFDDQGNFFRHVTPSAVTGSGNQRTLTVRIPQRTFEVMVIANSSVRVAAVNVGTATVSRTAWLNALYEDITAHGGRWNADPGSTGYAPFPMWGSTGLQPISDSNKSLSLDLQRMVAKVNVSQAAAVDNFTLKGVYVYNYNRYGYIGRTSDYTAPDVPAIANNKQFGPLAYTAAGLFKTDANGNPCIADEIFIFEATKCAGTAETQLNAATAIVIGGDYTDPQGTTTQNCYYRIDFKDNTGYLDVLRNRAYGIEVTSVSGYGSDTPDKAFYSRKTDLSCTVTKWNENEVATILSGDKRLFLSRRSIQFDKDGGSPTMTLTTTDAAGIVIEQDPASAGWLIITGYTAGATPQTITVKVTAATVDRSSFFWVVSGNMRYKVVVNQSKDPWITFTKCDAYLLNGGVKTLQALSTYPWDAAVTANPDGAMRSLFTAEGDGVAAGENVNFLSYDEVTRITAGSSNSIPFENTVTLTFRDKAGVCPDKTVDVLLVSGRMGVLSNCYILTASDNVPLIIPVSRANQTSLGEQIGANDKLKSMLVWSDNGSGIAASSNVAKVMPVEAGKTGYLWVKPGPAEGNAVIAVTDAGNTIRWSWHLWVLKSTNMPQPKDKVAYNNNKGFMDRDLGSLRNAWAGAGGTVTDPVIPLFYDWGRKDAFPQMFPPLAIGRPKQSGMSFSSSPGNPDLTTAIRQPTTFFTEWKGTASTWYRSDGQKSIYDPCPPGWRVPPTTKSMDPILWKTFTLWNKVSNDNSNWPNYMFIGYASVYTTYYHVVDDASANKYTVFELGSRNNSTKYGPNYHQSTGMTVVRCIQE